MSKYNPRNERIKRRYYDYMRHAKRRSENTIQAVNGALVRYEAYTKFKDFGTFNQHQAMAFKDHLVSEKAQRDGKLLSLSTIQHTLYNLKDFFAWLSGETGYKSKISLSDVEYLNFAEKEARTARARPSKTPPTLEQVKKAIMAMPTDSVFQRRNRALMALAILTGARDSALITLRVKNFDPASDLVDQNPNQVRTKASKHIHTYLVPLGDDLKAIFTDWYTELRQTHLFGEDDPLFPKTRMDMSAQGRLEAVGFERACWSSAQPVRKVFKEAFEQVGLPYFHPHLFRKTLVTIGEKRCRTAEEFKAWSQNIGHESVMTTLRSYGQVPLHRQGELIKTMTGEVVVTPELIQAVFKSIGFDGATLAQALTSKN